MHFLFKSKQRTPHELARSMREACARLGIVAVGGELQRTEAAASNETRRKAYEELYGGIQQAKLLLYGESGLDPVPESVAQFAQECYQMQLIQCLLLLLPRFEFEVGLAAYAGAPRCGPDRHRAAAAHDRDAAAYGGVHHGESVDCPARVPGVRRCRDCAANRDDAACDARARAARQVPAVFGRVGSILTSFYRFPAFIDTSSFGIACDAFANFRVRPQTNQLLLVRHKTIAAEYIQRHYERVRVCTDQFIALYNRLLDSSNYVTRRQSLKLLGEILVDRQHYDTMLRYVSSDANLKRIMNLLRDRSKNIQLEAFHVFKVFVANPRKTPAVETILQRNRSRLLAFLTDFLRDRTDESFLDERQYVLQIIAALPAPT